MLVPGHSPPPGKLGSELQVPDGVSCLVLTPGYDRKKGEVNQRKEQATMELAGGGHPELARILSLGCRAGHAMQRVRRSIMLL